MSIVKLSGKAVTPTAPASTPAWRLERAAVLAFSMLGSVRIPRKLFSSCGDLFSKRS